MSILTTLVEQPLLNALAWALVHFVWQGAALALAAWVLLRWLKPGAEARYLIGIATLALMLAAPVATVAWTAARSATPVPSVSGMAASAAVRPNPERPAVQFDRTERGIVQNPAGRSTSGQAAIVRALVLVLWAAGVVFFATRLFGGWLVARRLARGALRPAPAEIRALAQRVAGRLALDRLVRIMESHVVSVPVIVGWMKPVVLLPTAALSGLSTTQLEALIAHELAHVRRHDYLVNVLQTAVETLLFYHPAVWWVSGQVRAEREHCCDDLAVSVCDRVVYATALSDLAALVMRPRLALAATDGPLVKRIHRILGGPDDARTAGAWLPLFAVLVLAGALSPGLAARTPAPAAQTPAQQSTVTTAEPPSARVPVAARPAQETPAVAVAGKPQAQTTERVPASETRTTAASLPIGAAAAEAEQTTAERQAEARLEEMKRALAELQRKQLDLEQQRMVAESQARIKTLEAQLAAVEAQYKRMQQQVDVGTASREELAKLQAQLVELQQRLMAEHTSAELQKQEAQLKEQQSILEYEFQQRQMELDRALRPPPVAAARARTSEQVARETGVEWPAVDDPAAVVRPGDRLSVAISTEPDLHGPYTVSRAGTMHLPFLGDIRVVGLTARQVRDAITTQLQVHNLTRDASIDVTIRRPMGPAPR